MHEIFFPNISEPDLVKEFLKKFRKVDPLNIPTNLPTSCTLDGIRGKRVSELKDFKGNEEIYIYWDDSDLLRKDKIHSVVNF